MPTYAAPLDDIRFCLHEVLDYEQLTRMPGYEDATPDVVDQVVEEAGKMAAEVLFPLNQPGDLEGCHYENGVVRTPKGFREAYDQYCESGWPGLSADPQFGGQGLPHVVDTVVGEIVSSANLAFGMYPGLTHGAVNALVAHGSAEQKQTYVPNMVSGVWSGTMCLTEPQCGTDLGLIRTRADPAEDGSYRISGTKIYISAGEHDLTRNIVHLVLARLPDAPTGIRGISLFVVPKFLPRKENGEIVAGPRNGLMCGSIEHKMGITASATCVMNFDGATGWLVGEPHKGMRAMFTMMNAARLGVGIQGLGIGTVAYQNAVAFARDRVQGRSLAGVAEPEKPADPIIVHPDVRKNLMTIRAFTEGARMLAYWTGMALDRAHKHPDPRVRQEADDLAALMTPIVKAYLTDMGSEAANLCVQVHGGHGFIKDYGVEQYVRDARITQLYEGTNGIQALDLVGRKLSMGTGRLLRRFFHPVQGFIERHQKSDELKEFVEPLAKAFGRLQQATAAIAQRGLAKPEEAGAAATDYLRLFALVAMGFMWLRAAKVATRRINEADADQAFYDAKLKTARFFFARMLPETSARFQGVMAGADSLMAMDADQF